MGERIKVFAFYYKARFFMRRITRSRLSLQLTGDVKVINFNW